MSLFVHIDYLIRYEIAVVIVLIGSHVDASVPDLICSEDRPTARFTELCDTADERIKSL